MAQGCSVGLFDGEVRCFDRPIIMLGRGGNFHLYGRYCLCNGNLCSEKTEIWIQHGQKKFYAQRQKGVCFNWPYDHMPKNRLGHKLYLTQL
ncbi:unnamed protein product [Brugia timori]|uniref:Uncharacterized protein n=1 Tax=Brugia timori TaxID=42155 RepID=A0A0R3QGF4_9BILA|nr:unnamed protein product [Brugia timori]